MSDAGLQLSCVVKYLVNLHNEQLLPFVASYSVWNSKKTANDKEGGMNQITHGL